MKKEARIVTKEDDNHLYYSVEIKKTNGEWELCEDYIIDDELVSIVLIELLLSLLMQGYTIYDER